MLRALPFFLLLSTALHAQQWQLVTPVKTRSELAAVRMVSSTTGYTIDRVLGFVLKTTDAGDSWQRMPYNLIDKPRALWMWDDQRGIIAANSGRFYRTTNGWTSANSVSQPTFGNMACIHFVDDLLGWAGSESGRIVHTTDGGATWTQQTSGTTNAMLAIHFVDAQLGFASATGQVLLRTTDGGATWNAIAAPITFNMRGIHFFDALNGLAVGLGGEIIRTSDGGETWTLQAPVTTVSLLGLHAQGTNVLAMGVNGTLLRSTNSGNSWTLQNLDLQDLYGAWLNPGGIGLLVGKARVYRTTNAGASWSAVQVGTWHSMLNKVSFGNDQYGAAAGWLTSGGLENGSVRTSDGGRHWTNIAGNAQLLGAHLRSDGIGWLGGGSGAARRTTDNFVTTTTASGPSVAIRSVWSFNATTAIVAGGYVNGGCYRTTNNGGNWAYTATGNIFDLWFVNDQLGFCCGEGGVLHKTIDGGITWQQLTSPTFTNLNSVFFLNDTLGFIGGEASSWKTIDGGASWTLLGNVMQFCMSLFFTDPDTGYAVGVSGQALRSTDGGDTWNTILAAPFDAVIRDAALVDGALLCVGRYGDVYRAPLACPAVAAVPTVLFDGDELCTGEMPGIQWYLNGEALPDGTTACFTPLETGNYTVVTTDALGCLSASSAPVQVIITGIDAQHTKAPLLHPNPSSDNCMLTFSDARPRTIELCDAQGRVLHSERAQGPQHIVQLHALPSGLYLVRGVEEGWAVRVVVQP